MAQKATTLEIPELMQFLRQQLHDLGASLDTIKIYIQNQKET